MGRGDRDRRGSAMSPARLSGAIEAMVYGAVFAVALALVALLFGAAASESHRAAVLERAVELSNEAAETFIALPVDEDASYERDGLRLERIVTRIAEPFGFLYTAVIAVYEGDEAVYERSAVRYMSARGGGEI